MTAVYSFWSKPAALRGSAYKQNGGFPSRRHLALSWMLSVYLARANFPKLRLVTDSPGYAFLIGELGLPFDGVSTQLDGLSHMPGDLWALGKLHAYVQDGPFVHLDHDAYLFRKPGWMERTPLFCQYHESAADYYYPRLLREFSKPAYRTFNGFEEYRRKPLHLQRPVNAGVLGGTDYGFFREYAQEALSFVHGNLSAMGTNLHLNDTNVFWEQYLFSAFAEAAGKPVASFQQLPGWEAFTHLLGSSKSLPCNADRFEAVLLRLFPFLRAKVSEL